MNSSLNSVFSRVDASSLASVEGAKIDFALELNRLLDRVGMSKAELARTMGVSKPMVSKILRGDTNLTIETMAKAAFAANGRLHIKISHESCDGRWFEIFRGYAGKAVSSGHRECSVVRHPSDWNYLAANDNENQPVAA